MRLYRGLKRPYRPERVDTTAPFAGTDFTDCPYTALQYALTRRGVVLVLETPRTARLQVTEELWPGTEARRFMVWGRFDPFLVRIIPAKELRAQVRRAGAVAQPAQYKAGLLEGFIDRLLRDEPSSVTEAPAGLPATDRGDSGSRPRRGSLSTSTVRGDGQIVPWLAASGPLAYTPEDPPDRDYYFQYGWILPGIFAPHTNTRRHYYFGACHRDEARELFSFWKEARGGVVHRVARQEGTLTAEVFTAPVAVYHLGSTRAERRCLLVQHGSYQVVSVADQPLLESGEVLLYRGVQQATEYRLLHVGEVDSARRRTWRRYVGVSAYVLSDATRSFNSIHDRAKRCETGHLRDRSWITDKIARRHGLDIDCDGFARELWSSTHQSFSLARAVAEWKFGPHYVVCKTPLGNIRLTTFFAGEHEVRIIDPSQVEILEAHGCGGNRYGC